MKILTTLILSFIVISAVVISGCVQQDITTPPTGGDQLSQQSTEDAAVAAVEQEMEDALSNMTLEEIENELLTQG